MCARLLEFRDLRSAFVVSNTARYPEEVSELENNPNRTLSKLFYDPYTGCRAAFFVEDFGDSETVHLSFSGVVPEDYASIAAAVAMGYTQSKSQIFRDALDVVATRISSYPSNKKRTFVFSGNSMGGALAQFAAYTFANENPEVADIHFVGWNALGGVELIEMNGPFLENVAARIHSEHYRVQKDTVPFLVRRLNGPVFLLDDGVHYGHDISVLRNYIFVDQFLRFEETSPVPLQYPKLPRNKIVRGAIIALSKTLTATVRVGRFVSGSCSSRLNGSR